MRSCTSGACSLCRIGFACFGVVVFLIILNNHASEASEVGSTGSKGNIKFALDLYKEVGQTHENILTSPVSLEIILALTYLGANGNTARQIARVINRNNDSKAVTTEILSLLKLLKSVDNVTLESANGIFIHKDFKVKDDFKAASELLSSVVQITDFEESEPSAHVINKWVEQATSGKIRNIVSEDSITPLTKLMLVNAIYFKAPWKIPFNKKQTSVEPFYLNQTQKKDVSMMYMKKRVGYSQIDELQTDVLELQYEGQNLSMIILLPNAVDGLRALENQLRDVDIVESLKTMYPVEVEVTLPRFILESEINLNPVLVKLGLTDMFDENLADFSGISDAGLVVSQVKQKTFIEINEKGTEAAASTTCSLRMRRSVPQEKIFRVDHPFAFFVFDRMHDLILFFGRVADVIQQPNSAIHDEL